MVGLIILIAVVFIGAFIYNRKSRKDIKYKLAPGSKKMLLDNVTFYKNLDEVNRLDFENRVADFLAHTTVRGVDVEIEDLDRLLVASGAIMLIFSFPDWRYNNISEVLLYKGTFSKDFETEGAGRNILGMVGDGAMHRVMLLSKPSLRSSFQSSGDGHNTVLHEFAHLIDKADGVVDGVPEYLLSRPHLLPWIKEIRNDIDRMRSKGKSDIDLYGATSDAEFFAVISEYFFEKPDKLKINHPELFEMLEEMFHPGSK